MSAAESASLNLWSVVYFWGAWGVVLGVAMEVSEIIARRLAKRKQKQFIGPIQFPPVDPQTPDWAHNMGDVGFCILVLALVTEQVAHQRIEGIMGKEHDRITGELSTAIKQAGAANKLAGDANEQASSNEVQLAQLTQTNLLLSSDLLITRSNLAALQLQVQWRTISPEQETKLVNLLKPFSAFKLVSSDEIVVVASQQDIEAWMYAKKIAAVLTNCFKCRMEDAGIVWSGPNADIPLGMGLFAKGPRSPEFANAILDAFKAVGILPTIANLDTNAPASTTLEIRVWHKPEK